MNYTEIYNGMVGKDFIVAFNDNFRDTDTIIARILETLLTKVKSTDIKEFKIIGEGDQAVVYYTTEDPPEEGEDTREWKSVDTTKWGNITGDIADQTDLKNALDSKAEASSVSGIVSDLDNLTLGFNNLRNSYEDTAVIVNQQTQDIADLKVSNRTKVGSPNIKLIRVNDTEFQWSTDGGSSWSTVQRTTSIAWGNITGDLVNQGDLSAILDNLDDDIDTLGGTVSTLSNTITEKAAEIDGLSDDVDDLTTLVNNNDATYTTKFNTINNNISDLQTADTGLAGDIAAHEANQTNPHNVNKTQVGLGNVDNTADIDKPVSTLQQSYIDNQIQAVNTTISGYVKASGSTGSLFTGTLDEYNNLPSRTRVLAFILKNDWDATIHQNLLFNSTNPEMSGKVIIKNVSGGTYNNQIYESDSITSGVNTQFHNIPDGRYVINKGYYNVVGESPIDSITGVNPFKTTTMTIGVGSKQIDPTSTLDIKDELDAFVINNEVDYLDQLMLWIPDTIPYGSTALVSNDSTITLTEVPDYNSEPAPYTGYRYACYRTTDNNGKIDVNKTYTLSYEINSISRNTQISIGTSNILLPEVLVDDGLNTPAVYSTEFVVPASV